MKIGKLVELSLDLLHGGELEAAMMLACIAVDGTGKKAYPDAGSQRRFADVIRSGASVFGPIAMPALDVVRSRFAVETRTITAPQVVPYANVKLPDAADVIYAVHRCSHGHGDELRSGFELLPDMNSHPGLTRFELEPRKVRFTDHVIYALLAVAVLHEVNRDQTVPGEMALLITATLVTVNEWWGRGCDSFYAEFLAKWTHQNASALEVFFPDLEHRQVGGFTE